MYEVYEEVDVILPKIELPEEVGIRVEITDESVKLFVGPRDWSWSRKTGLVTGAGTDVSGMGWNIPLDDKP